MLFAIIFSFSHKGMFDTGKTKIMDRTQIERFCRQQFNPFPNIPLFLLVCSTNILKTLREKEKLLVSNNFSFSHSVFYPFAELNTIFIKFKTVVCKLFSLFPTVFSTLLQNLTLFSSNLKLWSANFFSLEAFKICRFGKG